MEVSDKDPLTIKDRKSTLREYGEVIALAILLALFVRTFMVQAFKIPSGSMLPTLQIGDHILVIKSIYGIRLPFVNKVIIPIKTPERGDIIVFIYPVDPSKDFIKRVVGLPGDKVEVRNRKVYINDSPAPSDHGFYDDPDLYPVMVKPRDEFGPLVVPPNKYFVMGDNRDHSYDSRFWGFVDIEAIRGKAFMIYWSWDSDNWRPRWNRLGSFLE
ncbi:MAG: signal peptidase I [Deltaproteobacteria bacterium]|nr:signal peptidase I [Deltaproteobacteria bacterium]